MHGVLRTTRITRLVEVHTEYIRSATREFEIHVHSVAYLNINQEAMIGTDSAKKAQNPFPFLGQPGYPRKPMEIKQNKKSLFMSIRTGSTE